MKVLAYFSFIFFLATIFISLPVVFSTELPLKSQEVTKDTTRIFDDDGNLTKLIIREDSFVLSDFFYVDGLLSSQNIYYPSMYESQIRATYITYYENGSVEHIISAKGDEMCGSEIYFYKNGQVKKQGCWSCCLPNGITDTSSLCRKKFYIQHITFDPMGSDQRTYFSWGYEQFYSNGQMKSKDSISEETNRHFTIEWDSLGNKIKTSSFIPE
jgi:hypothetical protein